eukprot:CAMPEP_0167760970 /NCGR_PEP_ID=MMETSP0110_2-20121227/11891_1 /TAXON_ID=629695 /ORGANISM="Gymnochlora sp., Strain CCMP2014" /LENGTH=166 /DNA_ID=CAMNT_0007647559 /DNA_START=97 /DNA_END=597 /DNA_ORIENTATION=-
MIVERLRGWRGLCTKTHNDAKKDDDGKKEQSHLLQLWNRYGWCGIGTYVVIDVVTLGSFYAAILYGINVQELLDRIYVLEAMYALGVSPEMLQSKASALFTAWALYSAVAPVRFALTFALTPAVTRYMDFSKARKARKQAEKEESESVKTKDSKADAGGREDTSSS